MKHGNIQLKYLQFRYTWFSVKLMTYLAFCSLGWSANQWIITQFSDFCIFILQIVFGSTLYYLIGELLLWCDLPSSVCQSSANFYTCSLGNLSSTLMPNAVYIILHQLALTVSAELMPCHSCPLCNNRCFPLFPSSTKRVPLSMVIILLQPNFS